VRKRIEYRFRVPSAAVFTLYSYSKALEYRFRVPTAGSLKRQQPEILDETQMPSSHQVRKMVFTSASDENSTDIFRPYSRPNSFRGVLIHPYPSSDI
jgi:hypothetical protein